MTQLTPEIVLQAYMRGIFPMAESRHDPHLYWIDPEIARNYSAEHISFAAAACANPADLA